MSLDRRNFLKTMGVAGISLAGVKSVKATPIVSAVELKSILIDTTRCEGCQSCEFACAEANGLQEPQDYPESGTLRSLSPENFTTVNAFEVDGEEIFVKKQCFHCNQPACDAACLTKAMNKKDTGPVVWDGSKCMGCRYCMVSCPFEIPQFEYFSANPQIRKCSMCWERQNEGELPACVENCPNEALTFGSRRDMLKLARKRVIENPDQYVDHIYGEHEAGGTGVLYLASVPFDKLGFKTDIETKPYPELTKGFLYSVPSIFVLWPAILLGLYRASSTNKERSHE